MAIKWGWGPQGTLKSGSPHFPKMGYSDTWKWKCQSRIGLYEKYEYIITVSVNVYGASPLAGWVLTLILDISFKFRCNSKRPLRNLTAFGASHTRFVSPLMLFMRQLQAPMLWPSTTCHLMIYLLITNFEFGEDPHLCSIPRVAGESSIHTLLVFVYVVKSYTHFPPICANCCNYIICPYTSSWKWKTMGCVCDFLVVGINRLFYQGS